MKIPTSWRSYGLLYLAAVVLFVAALLPLVLPRFLPLLDQPNHLAMIQIWNRLSDPRWGLGRFYAYHRVPVPYWGYYFPVHLLSYVLPLESANKLFLAAYVVALPLSVALLAAALGRSPAAGLLVVPFAFSHSFAWGFLSFVPGVPLLFFTLAALVRYFAAPSLRRAGLFFLLLEATYSMHILPWATAGLLSVVYVVGSVVRAPRACFAPTAVLLLSLLLGIWNALSFSNPNRVGGGERQLKMTFEPLKQRLELLHTRILSRWPHSRADEIVVGIIVVSVIVLGLVHLFAPSGDRAHAARPWVHRWFPELSAVLALVAYLKAPITLLKPVWIWFVSTRFAVLIVLFFVMTLRGRFSGRRQLLLVPAVAASVWYCAALSGRYLGFNRRAAELMPIIAQLPYGANTLTLLFGSNADRALDPTYLPWNEFYSYPTVFRGGYSPYGWELGFPFVVKAKLPVPYRTDPGSFSQWHHGQYYDYVLTRNEEYDGEAFGAAAERVPLVARSGAWRLYRTLGIK